MIKKNNILSINFNFYGFPVKSWICVKNILADIPVPNCEYSNWPILKNLLPGEGGVWREGRKGGEGGEERKQAKFVQTKVYEYVTVSETQTQDFFRKLCLIKNKHYHKNLN